MAGHSKPPSPDEGGSQQQSELPNTPCASQHIKNAKDDEDTMATLKNSTTLTYDELFNIYSRLQIDPNERVKLAQPAYPAFTDNLERSSSEDQPESGSGMADRPEPLVHTRWPPQGQTLRSKLSEEQAIALIRKGALYFAGSFFQASHIDTNHKRFYATADVEGAEHDATSFQPSCYHAAYMSLVLLHHGGHVMPSETFEQQPSMISCFGQLPGTVTLNQYVSLVDRPLHRKPCPDHYVVPRHTAHILVLQRLHFLQGGLDHDVDLAEDLLFTQLICDPEWVRGEAVQLLQQIPMLIAALDNPVWIDFRDPCAQVLAQFYDNHDVEVEQRFCHQLLLSVELYLRLEEFTRHFDKDDVRSLLAGINEKVAHDLALAQIWLSKMTFEPLDGGFLRPPTMFRITALTKTKQKERLLDFANNMKWAGIADVERMLEETDGGVVPLEGKSLWSSSWIAGAIFPGTSSSWLIMRSLIDCDPDLDNAPHGFDQMPSNFGFQYRGSTYWYWESIVGKVIGASKGVKQDHGWIGPCLQSRDLMKLQTLLIHSALPTRYLTRSRVKNMAARTAALGPLTDSYSIDEFVLPVPDFDNMVDWVRIQKLAFKRHSNPKSATDPTMYRAAVVFAVKDQTIPIRLRYDVSFIYVPPCKGQHVLFWDYAYETANVDDLLDLCSWNGVQLFQKPPGETSLPSSSSEPASEVPAAEKSPVEAGSSSSTPSSSKFAKCAPDVESVLVVEAFGVADNEVLARAWASHVGFSAIVANIQETCMACSIRAAYAAAVPMVILNEGYNGDKRRRAVH
ncbi:hypothetical protein N7G274_010606 [Stereocaulon virgatum]|uniref:Uncharacterized protein n=1 Tax=Stereocaulon virgatum TaxID=373712 RepID=A0ABR3ZUW5_9LECA